MTRPEPRNNFSAPSPAWNPSRANRPRPGRDGRRKPEDDIEEYTILKPRPGAPPKLTLAPAPPNPLRRQQIKNVVPPAMLLLMEDDSAMLDGPFKGSDRPEPSRPAALRPKPVRPSSGRRKRLSTPSQPPGADRTATAPGGSHAEAELSYLLPPPPAKQPGPPPNALNPPTVVPDPVGQPGRQALPPTPAAAIARAIRPLPAPGPTPAPVIFKEIKPAPAPAPASAGPVLSLAFDLPKIRSPYATRPAAPATGGAPGPAAATGPGNGTAPATQSRPTLDRKPATPSEYRRILEGKLEFPNRSPYRNLLEETPEAGSPAERTAGYVSDFATLTVDGFTFLPIDQMGRPIRR